MKFPLFMSTLLLCLSLHSQSHIDEPKDMVFIPSGSFETIIERDGKEVLLTVSVDAFWMSQEITNKEYREFMEEIKAYPEAELSWVNLKKLAEDRENAVQKKIENYLEIAKYGDIADDIIDLDKQPFELYFTSKKYDYYPVVGVSQQAAKFYCIWRTNKVNTERQQKGLPLVQNYRLPVEAEWEYAAQGQNESRLLSANYPTNIKNGKANNYGLYHMLDNVAEFTHNQSGFKKTEESAGKAVIKGGTAKQKAEASDRRLENECYTDSWTGFRVVRSYISQPPQK